MIAIAAFTVEELVSGQEVFEHLALRFENEVELEVLDVENEVVGAEVAVEKAVEGLEKAAGLLN